MAVAREAERLHKGTLSAMVMSDHVLPEEVIGLGGGWQREHPTARAAVIWRHRQAVQGSYTHRLKVKEAGALRQQASVNPDT